MNSPGDAAMPIDLVHDEICSRPKTLPFGCLCACQIAGRRLMKKYRGRKLLRCIYLGPSQAPGGGVFAIALGEREVELFPACRGIIENDRFVFLKEELIGIAGEDRRVLDVADPERPINFSTEPSSAPKRTLPRDENLLEDEGEEEELIPDVVPGYVPGRNPELGYDPEHGFSGPPSEGDYEPSLPGEPGGGIDADGDTLMEEDIEAVMIDLLIHESLLKVYKGPDVRYLCSVGSAKTRCFDVPFCGAKVRCYVPDNAVSETNGERLDPQLLEEAMRLELEELESFKVGTVVSEEMTKRVARTNGRRILTCRRVNTVKKPGLYRARLVVRDFASFGASTLQEGIYSPTTTLVLALVSESGSLISGDVSVAFMHADCARVEVIQMPNNVVLAKGGVVYVQLKKAVNGLRSAPLSWYREISSYLESIGFEQVIDPTIYRRFTKDSKGKVHLSIVLFYVDDILVWSQLSGEATTIFGLLSKKYKLKQTGIIEEHRSGEVSFLGRRIFRTKACEGSNVIFFGLDLHYLEGCCAEFQIKKGTAKLASLERIVREFERKGPSERLSPDAHDRYRRVLGKLAWGSLTRPDLAFVTGFLGRFQAAPTEAAEHAMRATLRWVLSMPPMAQRFPSQRVSLKNECDPREITLFVDASWSLDSTSGGIVSWMNCYLKAYSWKQPTTSLSSAEAELLSLTEGAKEAIYISLLVEQLLEGVQGDTGTYPIEALCDSQVAICISNMNSLLRKVRHLELRAQYIQEQVSSGRLRPSFLPGKENPADGLTKSPTEDMLWSLYEATGLVQWPELAWDNSRRVEFGDEEVVEVEAFDLSRIRIPDEWLEGATKVANNRVDLIVIELFCQAGSAISIACEKAHRAAYFGVTKNVDFLSYNCVGSLLELLKSLGNRSSLKVWCHISTPCTAGCGFRHINMRRETFLPKWREQIAQHVKAWNRILKLFAPRTENPRLLVSQEWPERTDLWYEESYTRVARQLKLTRSGCRVERCCFDGVVKTWYFMSNQPAFVQSLLKYGKCSGGHEHRKVEVKDSGFYPKELGRTLLNVARGVLRNTLGDT